MPLRFCTLVPKLEQPKIFFTINAPGLSNPRSVKVIEEMRKLLASPKYLEHHPYLAGVVCKVPENPADASSIDSNAVAVFDGECANHFSPIPPRPSQVPAWSERFNWCIVLSARSEKSPHTALRCANNMLIVFSKPFSKGIEEGHFPWGKPRDTVQHEGSAGRIRRKRRSRSMDPYSGGGIGWAW